MVSILTNSFRTKGSIKSMVFFISASFLSNGWGMELEPQNEKKSNQIMSEIADVYNEHIIHVKKNSQKIKLYNEGLRQEYWGTLQKKGLNPREKLHLTRLEEGKLFYIDGEKAETLLDQLNGELTENKNELNYFEGLIENLEDIQSSTSSDKDLLVSSLLETSTYKDFPSVKKANEDTKKRRANLQKMISILSSQKEKADKKLMVSHAKILDWLVKKDEKYKDPVNEKNAMDILEQLYPE
jgi:hypothetical protein